MRRIRALAMLAALSLAVALPLPTTTQAATSSGPIGFGTNGESSELLAFPKTKKKAAKKAKKSKRKKARKKAKRKAGKKKAGKRRKGRPGKVKRRPRACRVARDGQRCIGRCMGGSGFDVCRPVAVACTVTPPSTSASPDGSQPACRIEECDCVDDPDFCQAFIISTSESESESSTVPTVVCRGGCPEIRGGNQECVTKTTARTDEETGVTEVVFRCACETIETDGTTPE